MKIEGVPEGYEISRIGRPVQGETFIGGTGLVATATGGEVSGYAILRKIGKPKTYRPFANAEEFKPHRERWWKWKEDTSRFFPPASYDEFSHESETWIESFDFKMFEDGSPFGVEVSE